MAVIIGTLNAGNMTLGSGGSTPATHEETWYKYAGDTEWRTTMLGGEIALVDDMGEPTGQIDNPYDIVEIEIGTGTQSNPVTSIGDFAFSGCSGLTRVTIGDNVTSIGSYAFSGCNGITSVTIPDSVTSIEDGAFFLCSGLTRVTIPNGVTSIGENAFEYCNGLTGVTFIGKTLQQVQDIEDNEGNKYYPWGIDTSIINVA